MMSRSSPIKNAVKTMYIFNKLAQQGLVEGNIILSEGSEYKVLKMPVHDDVILAIGGTGGSEGLNKTITSNIDILKNRNLIVITDGDIVDEPLNPTYWDKNRINCIGMYVNEEIKTEDLPGYDKNLLRWFPKKIIRNSFDEMVQKLIQIGLKASTKG